MSTDDSLLSLQKRIREFVDKRDWSQFHSPKNLASALSVEASELLELYLWGDKPRKPEAVKEELADVFYYVLLFAEQQNIDLFEALNAKMDANELKYPVEKSKGNAKKYTDLQ